MESIRSILVYASLEDEAFTSLKVAASVARTSGASLSIVRVLGDPGRLRRWGTDRDDASQLRATLENHHRDLLERHVAPLRADGIEASIDLCWGRPWIELLHRVIRDRHDLVVKTASGSARGRGLYLGSTALHLIRESPCPVWVVGDRADATGLRVVVAVDVDPDPATAAMATRILRVGAQLASNGGELHCAFALRPLDEPLPSRHDAKVARVQRLEDVVRTARSEIESLVDRSGIKTETCRIHVLHGDVPEAIPRLARREKVDVVVLGTANRVDPQVSPCGETAELLARSLRCGVLALQPGDAEDRIERLEPIERAWGDR